MFVNNLFLRYHKHKIDREIFTLELDRLENDFPLESREAMENYQAPCCNDFTIECIACHYGISEYLYCFEKNKIYGDEPNICNSDGPFTCCKTFTPDCLGCTYGISGIEFCML